MFDPGLRAAYGPKFWPSADTQVGPHTKVSWQGGFNFITVISSTFAVQCGQFA